jgi:hypothetical protein
MSLLRRLAAIGAATALVVGGSLATAPTASAATETKIPATGVTRVTTAPGLAPALLRAGILPYGLSSTTTKARWTRADGLQLTYGFPVTGVTVDPGTSGATGDLNVLHSGGLGFINYRTFDRVAIRNFTIDVSAAAVTAQVYNVRTPDGARVPDGTRVPVFALSDLAGVSDRTVGGKRIVRVQSATVKLAPGIGALLNANLHTKVFAEGATIGTARVVVRAG